MEPLADGFRNFLKTNYAVTPEEMMLDKAQLLGLTAPEMTVLVGGLRTLGVSSDDRGLFSNDNSNLSNDYFTTLLDMSVKWKPTGSNSYDGMDRSTGDVLRRASRTDLVFGSNSQLRAIAEVYAQDDNKEKFIKQTSKVPLPVLLKVMDLISKCELDYRNTTNKRLLIELCLMQMASLHLEEK